MDSGRPPRRFVPLVCLSGSCQIEMLNPACCPLDEGWGGEGGDHQPTTPGFTILFKGGFGIAFCLFYFNINLDVNLSSRNTSLPSVFEALSPTPSPMEPPPLFDIRPLPLILFRLERFQSKIQILHPTPPTTAVLQLQTSCVLNNCSSLHFARFGSLMSTIDLT